MFLGTARPVHHMDPWNGSLPQRLRLLATGTQRVAYYYEQANNSTFRYRAYNMVEVINGESNDGVSASYFFQEDSTHLEEISRLADVLVICRSGYNQIVNQWITRFRNQGKRVFFDVDDFVFDTRYTHLLITTLGLDTHHHQVWEDWFAMMSRMGQTLRLCDAAITTNAFLARRISEFAQCDAAVVPNFMNAQQLAYSAQIYESKCANGFARDEKIHVGYFSGSPSHRLDFAIVEGALESVLERDERVYLTVVGYIDVGPGLARFGSRIVRHPFQDYVNLQRLVGAVELNLMPLQANLFTNCKSELKYFESAAVGTLSIASPSANYAAAIEHGTNGYLSRAHEWERQINSAIADFSQYAAMAHRANADALARYSCTHQRSTILRALGFA